MKKIISHPLTIGLAVIIIILGFMVIGFTRNQPALKEHIRNLEDKYLTSQKALKMAGTNVKILTKANEQKDHEFKAQRDTINQLKHYSALVTTKYRQRGKIIEQLTNQQADDTLKVIYPVDSTREKEILTDLNIGKQNGELLIICQKENKGLERVIDNRNEVIMNDSLIQANLNDQIKIQEDQKGILNEEIKTVKKRVKRLIIQRDLSILGAVAIVAISLL